MNKKALISSKNTEKEKNSEEISHSWCPFDFIENHEILVWINQPKQVGSNLSFCFYLENNQNDQLYGFKFEGRYNEYEFKPKYGILKPNVKMCIHGKVEAHYAELMENDTIVAYFHLVTQTEKILAKYWAENESNIHTRVIEIPVHFTTSQEAKKSFKSLYMKAEKTNKKKLKALESDVSANSTENTLKEVKKFDGCKKDVCKCFKWTNVVKEVDKHVRKDSAKKNTYKKRVSFSEFSEDKNVSFDLTEKIDKMKYFKNENISKNLNDDNENFGITKDSKKDLQAANSEYSVDFIQAQIKSDKKIEKGKKYKK